MTLLGCLCLIWRKSLVGILLVFSCWDIRHKCTPKTVSNGKISHDDCYLFIKVFYLTPPPLKIFLWMEFLSLLRRLERLQKDATLIGDGEAAGNTSLLALLFLELIIRTFRSSALTRRTVSAAKQRCLVKMSSQNEC